MTSNNVYKNILKFKLPEVSFFQFMEMLKSTSAQNTMTINWRTSVSPTHRVSYELYWGKSYSGSPQSVTKGFEGMVNLKAPNTDEGWRTLTYDNISSFSYKNKRYKIIY